MIEPLVNNTINAITLALFNSKDRILEAAKKRGQEKALKQIPTIEQFKNELNSYIVANNTPTNKAELEAKYNKAINLIQNAIEKLKIIKLPLDRTKTILDNAEKRIEFFEDIADLIAQLAKLLRGARTTLKAILASSSGPAANGTTINESGERLRKIEESIDRGTNIALSIPPIIEFFNEFIDELKPPVEQGIQSINQSIFILEQLLDQFQLTWTDFLTKTLNESNLANTPFDGFDFENGTNSKGDNPYISDVISESGPGTGNADSDSLVFKKFKKS